MLKTEAENDVKQQDQETQNEQVGVWHNPIESHDNGMTIEDLVEGNTNAEVASQGNQVCVRYHGELMNGDIVDPTDGEDDTYTFRLGAGEVIRGWDIGILGMRVGSTRRLRIPPALGFGDVAKPNIPANSWLLYDVELLKVKRVKRAP
uniref:peptidylprolyl isomerase n=1 Tax=Oryza brachyantha TaxID=4533 RepID=J3MVI5_ORYBR